MGARAVISNTIEDITRAVVDAAKGGDHILCMSNGGFDGIHKKLLDALLPVTKMS